MQALLDLGDDGSLGRADAYGVGDDLFEVALEQALAHIDRPDRQDHVSEDSDIDDAERLEAV